MSSFKWEAPVAESPGLLVWLPCTRPLVELEEEPVAKPPGARGCCSAALAQAIGENSNWLPSW